ncbi:MAG: hypothetical protein M1495_12880 [Bacteroidetes bacterium]|nr:hypothetical protein [Bacteroidota bacterium]
MIEKFFRYLAACGEEIHSAFEFWLVPIATQLNHAGGKERHIFRFGKSIMPFR